MVDKSRSRAEGGSGLAGACARIANAHGAKLEITSTERVGTTVTIAVPEVLPSERRLTMTRKADTLRPSAVRRCGAVQSGAAAGGVRPVDRALLAAPHTRTDGERFRQPDGQRHGLHPLRRRACDEGAARQQQPLGRRLDGGTMDGSALACARRTLRTLHEAGLLCDDSHAAALLGLPSGLRQLGAVHRSLRPDAAGAPPGRDLHRRRYRACVYPADFSGDDAPLYFNYQNDLGQGDTLADDAVAQYCTCWGWTNFATGSTRTGAQPCGISARQATARPRRSTPWQAAACTA